MPQISDDEYRYLHGRREVADFVESIYNDPQLTKEAKRLIKKKYPNLQIPDLEIDDKVESRFAQEKKLREDAEKAARQKEEDERYKKERERTQKDYGFTDEAMTKLERLMLEKNIGDYDVAASYMASKEPKVSEPTNESRFWSHEKQDGFAEIAKDPEKWAEKEIMGAIRKDEAQTKGWR
jgi:hypothetical protein